MKFQFFFKMWEIEIFFLQSSRNTVWTRGTSIEYERRGTCITSISIISFHFFSFIFFFTFIILIFFYPNTILKIKEFELKYLKFLEFKILLAKYALILLFLLVKYVFRHFSWQNVHPNQTLFTKYFKYFKTDFDWELVSKRNPLRSICLFWHVIPRTWFDLEYGLISGKNMLVPWVWSGKW